MNEIETALRALDVSAQQYRKTKADHEAARVAAIEDVVSALKAGARPTDVTERSPFSTALVRSIARQHGIAPAKKGPRVER